MQENRSRVNFRKLVHDLADMYQDHTFDVVLTELVANALDAKAREISISWDHQKRVLVVADDGAGMDAAVFEQYHDFAAELKTRGDGIGFAGVGSKISFNIADRVITETRGSGSSYASDWQWDGEGGLSWRHIPADRLNTDGTRVEVHFRDSNGLPDIDGGYLAAVLKRHYLPLFIDEFISAYTAISLYPNCPRFTVNGRPEPTKKLSVMASLTESSNFKFRDGWGAIGVSKRDCPAGNNTYGVLLCTHGKVIKSELFGQSTGMLGAKLFGIVEIPGLIEHLTTNKSDLRRRPGSRGKGHTELLAPVSDELKKFLAKHGVAVSEPQRNQMTEKLERELSKMLKQLPELQDFDGLLRKSRRLRKSDDGDILTSEVKSSNRGEKNGKQIREGSSGGGNSGSSSQADKSGDTRANTSRSRRNQGPRVAFEEQPGRAETAWLDADTIVINSGHAAYRNRTTNDSRVTYCMFSMGIALDKADIAQATDGSSYVDKFVTAWGRS